MKKFLLAAALAALVQIAAAQSSVTVFGVLDVNLRQQKNGAAGSIRSLSQDGLFSSRLGFRGVEDLGGGLRAGFWLEGAINPDTGGTTQTWQRRSTVSLSGGFGELRLGRDFAPTYWQIGIFDPFGAVGVASALNLVTQPGQSGALASGATTGVRASNAIVYLLPQGLGGVYGSALVSAGEGAIGNKYQGFRVGYASGPLNVAVGVAQTWANADAKLKLVNLGATWNFGPVMLYGQYQQYDYRSADETIWLLGLSAPLAGGTLKASVSQARGDGAGSGDAKQFGIGYVYELSKRTALYTSYGRIDNEAGSRYVTSSSGPANSATGQASTGIELGVRHSF